jgi:hypothetical protein
MCKPGFPCHSNTTAHYSAIKVHSLHRTAVAFTHFVRPGEAFEAPSEFPLTWFSWRGKPEQNPLFLLATSTSRIVTIARPKRTPHCIPGRRIGMFAQRPLWLQAAMFAARASLGAYPPGTGDYDQQCRGLTRPAHAAPA